MKLYTYFRSSASYRVRIALNLKGLEHQSEYIHLLKNGGEQHSKHYAAKNPQGLVPTLTDGEDDYFQSLAIIEYLDEKYPTPPLLPESLREKAVIRAMSQILVSDTLPIVNLRVLQTLKKTFDLDESQKQEWIQTWMYKGLHAFESCFDKYNLSGSFTLGEDATMADICLIPFVYNALRYNCDLVSFPKILEVYAHAMSQPAFTLASPANQADAYE